MPKTYPYVDYPEKVRNENVCAICGGRATHSRDVQFDWFRGNDEVVYLCAKHLRAPCTQVIKYAVWQAKLEKSDADKTL